MKRHVASVAALTLMLAFALGSGGGKDKETGGAEGGSTSTGTAAATGAAADGKPTMLAVCNNVKKGTCDEYYEFLPTLVPEMCPSEGGDFKKGPGACPTANLIGTCHYKSNKKGDPGQYAHHYANGAEDHDSLKKDCEADVGGGPKIWIEPPPSAKASASAAPAAASAPAAKAGTPAAKAPAAKPAATPAPAAKPATKK